jgi:hypothetical protein
MPVLKNVRHEKLAHGIAAGMTADAAYAAAGFKPDRGNAARLTANDSVRSRVEELQAEAEAEFVMSRTEWLESFARLARKSEEARDYSAAKGCLREIGLALPQWYAPQKSEMKVDARPAPTLDELVQSPAAVECLVESLVESELGRAAMRRALGISEA